MRARSLALVGLLLSCGGKTHEEVANTTPVTPIATPDAAPTPEDPNAGEKLPTEPEPTAALPDRPPEVFAPAVKTVGVGQTVSFSTAAIDQDFDETAVTVTKLPASATFDAITQTVTFTPTKADIGKATFELHIVQPGKGGDETRSWTIDVTAKKQTLPTAPAQSPMIEDVLLIHDPARLAQVNKDWPLDKMLLVGAQNFRWQFTDENRGKLAGELDKATMFEQFLTALAATHQNPRVDPKSPQFDKAVFGTPSNWQIVAIRPRVDKAWTELRVVYRAVKAAEPTFAMFRVRPTVEYVPALPRPDDERTANNKTFLGMVAKNLLKDGAPNPKFVKDKIAHAKAVAQLMNDVMLFDDTKTAPYLRGFVIGIAVEARLGGGSVRAADGTYKSGDGWAWSAMKPFQSGTTQKWQNVVIPGFWLATAPTADHGWGPVCPPKFNPADPKHQAGYEVLCRKTIGFVDIPDTSGEKVVGSKIDSNVVAKDYKLKEMVATMAIDDGRRDLGEENGMSCAQCHIRTFGMHDYADPANVDSTKGQPKARNKPIATLNFVIVPDTHWEEFTLNFLAHQECRGKHLIEQYLGADAAKGFACSLGDASASFPPGP